MSRLWPVALIAALMYDVTPARAALPAALAPALAQQAADVAPYPKRVPAPSLDGGAEWFNTSAPLQLKDLRGKVVLLDFWTYCCINCIHMIPILKELEKKYPNELVVIGVHSPKFANEQESESVRDAVKRYGLTHPVVSDANYAIWQKYGANVWPSFALIDPEGNLCTAGTGELPFDELEKHVLRLTNYYRRAGKLDETPLHFELEKPGDGPLSYPGKILADAAGGRLFISDSSHHRIVVASMEGELLEVIGSGREGVDDGPFDKASFNDPQGLALDGTTLYVADHHNHRIRSVDLKGRVVSTLAGNGNQAPVGARGGPSTRSAISSPWDLAVVGRDLYIAMAGVHQIWKLSSSLKTVRPWSGTGVEDILDGTLKTAAHAQPSGIVSDGRLLFVVDSEGSAVRSVPLLPAGNVATIAGPSGLPQAKSLFEFGDRDGYGSGARLQHPIGLTYLDGTVYVADTYNHKIKRIDPADGRCETLLGDGMPGDSDDPPRFREPAGLSAAAGKLYIADTNNHRIRVADLSTGKVGTLELKGLLPPLATPYSPLATLPNARQVSLEKQSVKPGGTLTLSASIALPAGFKMNPDLGMKHRVTSKAANGIADLAAFSDYRRAAAGESSLVVEVPLKAAAGSDELELSVVFYYCRDGVAGFCKIQSVTWRVPVTLDPAATTDRIQLDYTIGETASSAATLSTE